MRDSRNVTAVCDDAEEVSKEQADAARLTVCSFAEDAAEAEEFMKMLGIHSSQDSESLITTRGLR